MREILFRGKHKYGGEWVEGYYCLKKYKYAGDKTFMSETHTITTGIMEASGAYQEHVEEIKYEVIPESIGQFTNLTDKNGRKVFEGDIIEIDYVINTCYWKESPETYKPRRSHSLHYDEEKNTLTYKRNYAVEWKEKDARWIIRNGSDQHNLNKIYLSYHNVIIIGNIHENPELLKGGGKG